MGCDWWNLLLLYFAPSDMRTARQDMETFQRMHGLDADALRRIHSRFVEVDTVRCITKRLLSLAR